MTTRVKMILYTGALFTAGAVCGAAVLYHLKPPAAQNQLTLGRSDEIACLIRQRLTASLNLTDAQIAKFDPLIKKTSEELESSHRTCLERINAAIEILHTQICRDLTPQQKQMLKELETQRNAAMWEKYRYKPDSTNTAGGQ